RFLQHDVESCIERRTRQCVPSDGRRAQRDGVDRETRFQERRNVAERAHAVDLMISADRRGELERRILLQGRYVLIARDLTDADERDPERRAPRALRRSARRARGLPICRHFCHSSTRWEICLTYVPYKLITAVVSTSYGLRSRALRPAFRRHALARLLLQASRRRRHDCCRLDNSAQRDWRTRAKK